MSIEVAYADKDTPVTTIFLERHHPQDLHRFVPAEDDNRGEKGWLVSQEPWLAPNTLKPVDVDVIAGRREKEETSLYMEFVDGIAGFTEPSHFTLNPNSLQESSKRTVEVAQRLSDTILPECFYVAASSRTSYMNQYHTLLGELVGAVIVDTIRVEPVVLDKDNKPGLFPVGLSFKPYFYDINDVYRILHPKPSQATAS